MRAFNFQALQPDAAQLQALAATSQYQQYTQLPVQNQQLPPVQQTTLQQYGGNSRHETITPPGVEYASSSLIKIEPKNDSAAAAAAAAAHATHAQLYN